MNLYIISIESSGRIFFLECATTATLLIFDVWTLSKTLKCRQGSLSASLPFKLSFVSIISEITIFTFVSVVIICWFLSVMRLSKVFSDWLCPYCCFWVDFWVFVSRRSWHIFDTKVTKTRNVGVSKFLYNLPTDIHLENMKKMIFWNKFFSFDIFLKNVIKWINKC